MEQDTPGSDTHLPETIKQLLQIALQMSSIVK